MTAAERHAGPLSVLNEVVSGDVGTDRLNATNLADSFTAVLAVTDAVTEVNEGAATPPAEPYRL